MNIPDDTRFHAKKAIFRNSLVCIGIIAIILLIYRLGYEIKGVFSCVAIAIPLVNLIIGIFEFSTGIPFAKLDAFWMSLKGWQRGLIGSAIVLLACVIIFFGMIVVFYKGIP